MAEPKKINFQSHLCLYFSEIYNPPNYKSFMKSKFFRILKKTYQNPKKLSHIFRFT